MPKRKEPEIDPKEQFKRFQKAAKEHGVNETSADIENAFKTMASKPKKKNA